MELTQQQLKNRWVDIKKQIKERPLLAYRVNIPLEKWDAYMLSVPEDSEINRIYEAIQEDRKVKTLRLKLALSKIVGYRESAEYSRKSGVSDSYISAIIEGKKEMVGYDVINRLELFLSLVSDFEISIENPLTTKEFSQQLMDDIRKDLGTVINSFERLNNELYQIGRNMKIPDNPYSFSIKKPEDTIEYYLVMLEDIKTRIKNYSELYLK